MSCISTIQTVSCPSSPVGGSVTTSSKSNQPPVPQSPRRWRRSWLGLAIFGTILVIAAVVCVFAAVALLRPTAPRWYAVEMTTDISRRNVVLSQQLRTEAARRHIDILLTEKEYGTLDA